MSFGYKRLARMQDPARRTGVASLLLARETDSSITLASSGRLYTNEFLKCPRSLSIATVGSLPLGVACYNQDPGCWCLVKVMELYRARLHTIFNPDSPARALPITSECDFAGRMVSLSNRRAVPGLGDLLLVVG